MSNKFLEILDKHPSNGVIILGAFVAFTLLLVINYLTRTGVIARATLKEAIRQPAFPLLAGVGSAMILINMFVPFFSFDDDTRMFIECGLATVQICALIMAVWTASTSVADEIDGKTAMTLLSKPVNRQQFIIGKYLGIVQASLLVLVLTSVVFFFATYFKYGYDQGEHGAEAPPLFSYPLEGTFSWLPYFVPLRIESALSVFPGLALVALEVVVLSAISVAISTRFPMMVNVLASLAIFALGHLTPLLVQSGVHPVVRFVAQVLATVFPALDHFNLQGTSALVPPDYLQYALMYCCAYTTLMLMVALISFEDRDLA